MSTFNFISRCLRLLNAENDDLMDSASGYMGYGLMQSQCARDKSFLTIDLPAPEVSR